MGERQQRAALAGQRAVHSGIGRLRGPGVQPGRAQQRGGLAGRMPARPGADRQHPPAAQPLRHRDHGRLISQDPCQRLGLAVHRLPHHADPRPGCSRDIPPNTPDQATAIGSPVPTDDLIRGPSR